MGLVKAE